MMPKDVEKNPSKAGRKNHAPTPEKQNLVKLSMAVDLTSGETASCLQIDLKTLRKYYAEELEAGREQANVQVAASIFKQAVKGNMQAAIYWSKVHMGWRDNSEQTTVINIAPQKIEAPRLRERQLTLMQSEIVRKLSGYPDLKPWSHNPAHGFRVLVVGRRTGKSFLSGFILSTR